MKKSLWIGLLAAALVASLGALASAERGFVFGAVQFYELGGPTTPVVGAEFKVADSLHVLPTYDVDDGGFELRARYGSGVGVYGSALYFDGELDHWGAGGYLERYLTNDLIYRINLGVIGFNNFDDNLVIVPDLSLDWKYDVAGPIALVGAVSYYFARTGLGISF